jgi:hypothetical protein
MSNRKSPAASELYRERRVADRERTFERRSARQGKRAARVAFGGAA